MTKPFRIIIVPILVLLTSVFLFDVYQNRVIETEYTAPPLVIKNEPVNSPAYPGWQFVDAGSFTLSLSEGWKYNKLQGIDSYVGEFTGDGITLRFDYGWYSGSPENSSDADKHVITHENIGGRDAEIFVPKIVGDGEVGVYFGNLPDPKNFPVTMASNSSGFRLSGYKLTSSQQELALKIFRTLSFRDESVNPPAQQVQVQNFSAFSTAPTPPFIGDLKTASDLKIDFHYEGDYLLPYSWSTPEFYTPEGSTEKFLSLSKVKDKEDKYSYGPELFPIFTSQESHSYQGTPIYLFNQDSKYKVSYIGFKISDRDLISELKVEFGIDYITSHYQSSITSQKTSAFSSIFGIKTANACGPGMYLREVGDSNLVFMEESNGVAWYRLEKPVALYNLELSYCTDPPEPRPSYCNDEAEDPRECWKYCYHNASISSLKDGNLRMHVFYRPNDKEGFLKLQMASLILSDPAGAHYQATMGENFDHYYRAYLH